MSDDLSKTIEVLRCYALNKDAGGQARKALFALGIFVCDICGQEADEKERQRIEQDVRQNGCFAAPKRWLCPTCAPDLLAASSGLCWETVEVVGDSMSSKSR